MLCQLFISIAEFVVCLASLNIEEDSIVLALLREHSQVSYCLAHLVANTVAKIINLFVLILLLLGSLKVEDRFLVSLQLSHAVVHFLL